MDENILKRKREEEEGSEVEGVELEKPMQDLKKAEKQSKKQKREFKASELNTNESEKDFSASKKTEAEKRREKRERQKVKEQAKATKIEAKKAKKQQQAEVRETPKEDTGVGGESDGDDDPRTGDIDHIDIGGILDEPQKQPPSTATPSPVPQSPPFDVSAGHSGSSSISSIAPPIIVEDSHPKKVTKELKLPKTDSEELKVRLQQRIEELRAARKADGLNGAPAKNRQELMEARRRKEEQRRAHKKELRQKAKEEEERQRQLTISRGSPLLSPASGSNAIASPLRESTNNFSFGRIAFSNTEFADPTLSTTLSLPKKKGPQDPQTALQAAEKKKSRIAGLDDATRTDIEEKDLWLNARKRAHGERIRDDTSLLKKTLKRKEKQKKKSEKEWGERTEGVQKSQAMRQKKREDNLAKRRDEKGGKGGKKKGGGAKKGGKKARPGFEGSFRAKAPGRK